MLANPTSRECDRFIPSRSYNRACHPDSLFPTGSYIPDSQYSHLIKKKLFEEPNGRLVTFGEREAEDLDFRSEQSTTYKNAINHKVESPVKVLNIAGFRDDFYLNYLDWSKKGPLAIALGIDVYLYTPESLLEVGSAPFSSYISGLKVLDGMMAVGLSNGLIEIIDLQKNCFTRTLKCHNSRVGSLTFVDDMLVSGSKDKSILVHDLRQFKTKIRTFDQHTGEICALKTKNDGNKVFASGSSDGSAIVWDIKNGMISQFKGHKGAVKALDWCPWKNGLLATGGGNKTDKSIKIWNTSTSKLVANQKIQSQISGLIWNQDLKMIATSHGFEKNELNFWTMESNNSSGCKLVNQRSFKAHDHRILNMAQSNDNNFLCTVGADESMKFWCLRSSDSNPFWPDLSQPQEEECIRI